MFCTKLEISIQTIYAKLVSSHLPTPEIDVNDSISIFSRVQVKEKQ